MSVLSRAWQYDGNNRLTKIGDGECGSQDAICYAYDEFGRLAQETRSLDNQAHTARYAYDRGNLSGMTLPSGRQVLYTRNSLGQIYQIRLVEAGGQTRNVASNIAYHPFGGPKRWVDSAGYGHAMGKSRRLKCHT